MDFCNVNNYKSISLFFCLVLRMFLTNFHCAPSKKVIRKCQSCFQVWIGEKKNNSRSHSCSRWLRSRHTLVRERRGWITLALGVFAREQDCGIGYGM